MTSIHAESPPVDIRLIAQTSEIADGSPGSCTRTNNPIRVPLDTLANEINARLHKSEQMLISGGRQLQEARERVEAGEAGNVTWSDWCGTFTDAKKAVRRRKG